MMRKKAALIIGAIVVLMALFPLVVLRLLKIKYDDKSPLSFTAQLWEEQPKKRYRMWESLRQQHNDFSEMTRETIAELLLIDGAKYSKDELWLYLAHEYSDKITMIYFKFDKDGNFAGYDLTEAEI